MPAERAGYTVTMFLVDISPSMGKFRPVELPGTADGEPNTIEMTNLEWSLQFVMLKIQEMIFNGRKTDQCGVILFGSQETHNIINEKSGGYEHVSEYIPIGQPNAGTLAKLAALTPSNVVGDPIDALIVGIETQHQYLASKKTWTRKIMLLTDGENPIEVEDWEATTHKMNTLNVIFAIIGVDFDDDELLFHEEDKPDMKRENEKFFHTFIEKVDRGVIGNCDFALGELARPEIKQTKSALMGTVLRLGDVEARPEEAIELLVKISKCTAVARPKSWKKFARREFADDEPADPDKTVFAQLKMRTDYVAEPEERAEEDEDEKMDEDRPKEEPRRYEKEELVRGFKYGASYAPCPDDQFPRLSTRKGIDICGFFKGKNFRRELAMSEVQYIWADPASPLQQVALSSIVQAMYEKSAMAIARWVSRDGMDPKMGVLSPMMFDNVDCLMWVQMPFAEDVRNFPFASLKTLLTKKGEVVEQHPYLPTKMQRTAMGNFVDAMDLTDAGDKDEDGVRQPWFDTTLSYNPAVHRTKQALFHGAIVTDLNTHPLPPPHPELLKYFEPPRRVLKRARPAIEECMQAFKVREVPKKVARSRKDGHVRAADEDEDMILLDKLPTRTSSLAPAASMSRSQARAQPANARSQRAKPRPASPDSGSETEPETDNEVSLAREDALPTPAPESQLDLEPGRAPGRIVGTTQPLEDFKKNVARGDVVTKAVEDFAAAVKEIVLRPFASRRTAELLDCMQELRRVALEEDEIDAWNAFLRDLRSSCLDKKPGNQAFWERVKKSGRDMSLISQPEAARLGGKSDVSESDAVEFIQE